MRVLNNDRMPKSLPPFIRRQIIAFDPNAPDAPTISAFCKSLSITRPSFYTIRQRFLTEGNRALNPHPRTPKQPARIYDATTIDIVLSIRHRLKNEGWDAGPRSIWHLGVDEALFAGKIPSRATIGRILADAGVVETNPRKRPRKSFIRFQRSAAMELWQLDAFQYTLFDTDKTTITVYQLVGDSTRYDVGTNAAVNPENGRDAVAIVAAAIAKHGSPRELLSDNGSAFNLSRKGAVTRLQMYLADHGCTPITGRIKSPTTQGKNERSHQTICRFLDAHAHQSLEQALTLIGRYCEYYNQRRHHQSLPAEMTPGQAWDAVEHHPSDGTAIPHADLFAKAVAYRDQRVADAAAKATNEDSRATVPTAATSRHTATGRLHQSADEIVITAENPQIYLHGKMLRVPKALVGTYELVITDCEYMLFDIADGTEALGFPLPLETKSTTGRLVPLWKVHGARIRDPKPSWTQKHLAYEAEHYPVETKDTGPGDEVSTKP